jgi:ubiquinone/menaquinone biosynthesis C-methylase UbiE
VTKPRKQLRLVSPRSRDELAAEWDGLAEHREELISEGRDLSYHHILLPRLKELAAQWVVPGARIIDVGCGTGTFVAQLAKENPQTRFLAIDPSEMSIEVARSRRARLDNLEFQAAAVEDVSAHGPDREFGLVIANMLFQNVASIDDALASCAELLGKGGALVFAIPHPCFWPRYWRYDEKPWFRYWRELWIDAPFRTSLAPNAELRTTHTHRPLGAYFAAVKNAGLYVDELCEPMPDEGIEGEYPIAWEFPRFLLGRCLLRG